MLTAAESVAAAIFGIQIGTLCDRIDPDKTMLASNLIGAVSTAVLFALLYFHFISFISLILLMLIIGIVTLGFDISRTGYTVALVPKNRIPHANSLIEGANAVGEGTNRVLAVGFSMLQEQPFLSYLTSYHILSVHYLFLLIFGLRKNQDYMNRL
ncbi:MFS transporter [Clostridioides difficile]|nr:MFS transporter [Clostridioides difficile]